MYKEIRENGLEIKKNRNTGQIENQSVQTDQFKQIRMWILNYGVRLRAGTHTEQMVVFVYMHRVRISVTS